MNSYLGQTPVFGDFPFQILSGDGTSFYELNFKTNGTNGLLVFLNGAVQRPGVDFTCDGNALTFSANVSVGVQIFVYGMGLPKSSLAPSAGSVGLAELSASVKASSTEVTALVNNEKLVTPASLAGLPITKEYVSPEQTITSGGALTLTHGLGITPKLFQVALVCKVAERGYSVNDIVPVSTNAQDAGNGYGVAIRPDSTNLNCGFGSAGFIVLHATTGVASSATNANWRLIVRAYA